MAAEAREAHLGFLTRMTRGRPWMRIKAAASLDGRIALANGESQWITGEAARRDVHALRARSCAMLTGIGTVLRDDPELTVRHVPRSRQPRRVLIDSRLDIAPRRRRSSQGEPPIIFTVSADAAKRASASRRWARRSSRAPIDPDEARQDRPRGDRARARRARLQRGHRRDRRQAERLAARRRRHRRDRALPRAEAPRRQRAGSLRAAGVHAPRAGAASRASSTCARSARTCASPRGWGLMFTGIVTAVGRIASARSRAATACACASRRRGFGLDDVAIGDSIAIQGVCHTVVAKDARGFEVDTSRATLDVTTGLEAGPRGEPGEVAAPLRPPRRPPRAGPRRRRGHRGCLRRPGRQLAPGGRGARGDSRASSRARARSPSTA